MLTNKEKLTAQAQRFIEKGHYDKAIREYLKIVAEDRKDVRTWLKIGDLFVRLGQKGDAAKTYQKVARFYADQGFYLKAVAVYKQILKIDPQLIDIHLHLADLYRQLGLIQDAIVQYETIASHLQRDGRSRDAMAAHRAILELDPQNVAQRIKLAELYSKEKMVNEAAREFRITSEQLRALGRTDDFIKVAERLLFHDPENHPIARELAGHYLQRGDPRRALTRLQACFKADPNNIETLELLAEAFLALRQHQKSISVLKELARLYNERGQEERATYAYRRILEIDPMDAEARTATRQPAAPPPPPPEVHEQHAPERLIVSAEPARRDDLTREALRTITEADVYAKYGLYHKAIEHLESILVREPAFPDVRLRLSHLYESVGQGERALAQLWALASDATSREDLAHYLGEILRIDPHNQAAVARWREIQSQGGGDWQLPESGLRSPEISEDELRAAPRSAGSKPADAHAEHPAAEHDAEDESSQALKDDLLEVDFFLRQNMRNEARRLLTSLLASHPQSALISQRLRDIDALPEGDDVPIPERPTQRELSSEGQAGASVERIEEPAWSGPVFEVTRQGLRERGSSRSDAASNFDLGIAYRDMGLYPDAIAEFRKAIKDQKREVQCRTLIGICFSDQGLHQEAIAEWKRALYVNGISEEQQVEIYYNLGRSYERIADRKESLYFYEKAFKRNKDYRDTRQRIAMLKG